ncbi:MAG: S9 family peptidase [Alphaproteobacteria bacterium]|nr:S9 family peptidase [Alphaproteobacteria bacterium]
MLLLGASPPVAAPEPVPIEALAQIPFISEPELSPDGRHLVARINANGIQKLAVYDVDLPRDAPPKLIDSGGGAAWYSWAGNARLILGGAFFAIAAATKSIKLTSLESYDLETGKTSPIQPAEGMLANQVAFIDPAGRYVLVSSYKSGGDSPSLWRVDLGTGAAVEVQRGKSGISNWFVDDAGNVRGGVAYSTTGWTIYRQDASGQLRRASEGKFPKGAETAIDAIGILGGGDTGVIVTNARTGRFGVYRYDLNAQTIGEPIFEHPQVDVTKPQISADGRTVEAVYYDEDVPRVAWLTPELKALQAQVDRAMPGKVNRILNFSRDRNRALIWSGSADDPGLYYVFDRKARRLDAFAAPYDDLVERRLSPVKPVRYAARDGLSIPGYLTLPSGRDAKNLPLIVMPHGGPFVRDTFAFDPLVQLLASRGYAVLQPNYRGSTGFGRDYVERGYGQWGLKMQDDLDDGVSWLAGQGIVDRRRVCIVGASYGGYAALWGAIRNPEIYRCAVSLAGVTDLKAMLKYDSQLLSAPRYSKLWRQKVEGEEKRDLAAVSPLQQASRLNVPVLVAHGERDSTVPVDQSRRLVAALKSRGARVISVFYPRTGHGFSSSEESIDYMRRVEAFLELNNPPDGMPAAKAREARIVAGGPSAARLLLANSRKPKSKAMEIAFTVTDYGAVRGCRVTATSGNDDIDKKACAIAEEQVQYSPAIGADGRPVESEARYRIALEAGKRAD